MIRVCVDFDGVLYDTANRRALPGAINFVHNCIENGYKVVVHSERSERPAGVRWIKQWLNDECGVEGVDVAITKPEADIYIDDKGLRFEGTYPTMDDIFNLAQKICETAGSP
jgi:hypothetical protein